MPVLVSSLLRALSSGYFPSCRQEPDALFEKSASERVDALTSELQKTLTASSTGWVLEYYPHTQLLYGGYPVTMTFGAKNEVLMASDAPVKGHSTDEVKSKLPSEVRQDGLAELRHV